MKIVYILTVSCIVCGVCASCGDRWNPGCYWSETVDSSNVDFRDYVPYQLLGIDGMSEAQLRHIYGVPIEFESILLKNGRTEDDIEMLNLGFDIDDDKDRTDAGAIYYHIRPDLADRFFKDKECRVYEIVWRIRTSPDSAKEDDMYMAVYFVDDCGIRRAIWGYKTVLMNVGSGDCSDYYVDCASGERNCVILYDYVDPVTADSLFNDK